MVLYAFPGFSIKRLPFGAYIVYDCVNAVNNGLLDFKALVKGQWAEVHSGACPIGPVQSNSRHRGLETNCVRST